MPLEFLILHDLEIFNEIYQSFTISSYTIEYNVIFFCFQGVGFAVKPVPRTLLPGDVVRIEVEHIGTLENNVVE